MHIIGFSHHYTKLHGQTYGTLLSVRSTKPIGYRPDDYGIRYDTQYPDVGVDAYHPDIVLRGCTYYLLKKEDFDKPLLQLVFIGGEHQIPFTTYREFPKDYKPFHPGRRMYRKTIPYSDLIGDIFAFKFKGEELPEGLANKISGRPGSHVEIFASVREFSPAVASSSNQKSNNKTERSKHDSSQG